MTAYCKCGAWCDHLEEGGCDGDVIAIDEAPCPKHRCYAHCRKYGFTMALTVRGEEPQANKETP